MKKKEIKKEPKSNDLSEKETQLHKKSRLRENVEAVLVAILLALFIRTFVVQAFKIPSGSMMQTLQIGDHILVNKFVYGIKIPYMRKTIIPVKQPERGDIIVFKFPVDPEKDFIKRVIGVGGDVVEGRDKKIYINNRLVDDSYSIRTDPNVIPQSVQKRDNFGPITVPQNFLFVMGDNRDQSFDSRFWGFVDLKVVSGKAFMIYWSWDQQNFGVRWNRLGRLLK
jgi:signal peptidase I